MKVSKHFYPKMPTFILWKFDWTMGNFQLLEVVGRGSETQLQVGEN